MYPSSSSPSSSYFILVAPSNTAAFLNSTHLYISICINPSLTSFHILLHHSAYNINITNSLMSTLRHIYAHCLHYFSQEHHVFDNTILGLVVVTLLGILRLSSVSPFNTHPIAVFVALGGVLMYGVSCDVEGRYNQTNVVVVNIARHGRVVFGSLLVVSLTSIMVPSFLQPIVFLAFVLLYAYRWIRWLQEVVMGADEHEVEGTDAV
ncbi:hypothetical protein E3N88_26944 [Mikania micrantha]|uniref:Uncharacterized protein n=1 Tax=Mikania micrantha TaxID=192012 RepID=A0A5N6MVA5_9ASTR|nr:hypothetical protein E3N88_26944 [Mikania micrantha]